MSAPARGSAALSRDARGLAAGATAMAVFGSLFVTADVVEGYPLAAGQAIRFAISALILLAIARATLQRPALRDLGAIAALTATGVVGYNLAVLLAVHEADPATVGVIVSCLPIVVAIAGPLLARRRIAGHTLVAAAVVSVGAIAVQYTGGGVSAQGIGLALLALAFEVAFSLLAVPTMRRLSALTVATYSCLMAVPMLVAVELAFGGGGALFPAPTAQEAVAFVHLGVLVTPAAFVLWYYAIGTIGVERTALLAGILPISVLVCAVLLGAADLTPLSVLGTLLVAAGICIGMARPEPDAAGRESPRL